MKNLVFKVSSDKSPYKIRYRHLFEDFSLSSDGAGSELSKRQLELGPGLSLAISEFGSNIAKLGI